MRETWALFLILAGSCFVWVGVHGYQGSGLPGLLNTIYGHL
jgi:hypothetical protein